LTRCPSRVREPALIDYRRRRITRAPTWRAIKVESLRVLLRVGQRWPTLVFFRCWHRWRSAFRLLLVRWLSEVSPIFPLRFSFSSWYYRRGGRAAVSPAVVDVLTT